MPYTNEKEIRQAAEIQRKELADLKLSAVKLGVHASERVLNNLIDKAFAYQEKVDSLLIEAIGSEHGGRFIELAQLNYDLAGKMIDSATQLLNKLIDLEAARLGLTSH